MAPHIDTRTWTYGSVSRRTLTQDTADANYMLFTVVVNGHNCVVLLSAVVVTESNATCERCSITKSLYVAAIGLRQRTVNIQRCTHCEWGLMLVPSTLASFMLSPRSVLSSLPRAGVLM